MLFCSKLIFQLVASKNRTCPTSEYAYFAIIQYAKKKQNKKTTESQLKRISKFSVFMIQ